MHGSSRRVSLLTVLTLLSPDFLRHQGQADQREGLRVAES